MGKVIALAIMSGHPGPQNLYKFIVNYILFGKDPDELLVAHINRQDIANVIREVSL